MTDGHDQSKPISNLHLQAVFPDPRARAITAATIRFDQQLAGLWIAFWQFGLAPMRDIVHGEGRRIGRLPNIGPNVAKAQISARYDCIFVSSLLLPTATLLRR